MQGRMSLFQTWGMDVSGSIRGGAAGSSGGVVGVECAGGSSIGEIVGASVGGIRLFRCKVWGEGEWDRSVCVSKLFVCAPQWRRFKARGDTDHISLPIHTETDPNHVCVAARPTFSQPSPHPGVVAGVLSMSTTRGRI